MTILSVALGRNAVAILQDGRSCTPSGEPSGDANCKCVAVPTLSLLVGQTGDSGITRVVHDLHEFLRAASGDVLSIAPCATALLRDISARRGFSGRGRVVLAGISGVRAYAFELDAPDWVACPIGIGASLQPGPKGAADVPGKIAVTVSGEVVPCDDEPDCEMDYQTSLRIVVSSRGWQVRENPNGCGGVMVLSTIGRDRIIKQMILPDEADQ